MLHRMYRRTTPLSYVGVPARDGEPERLLLGPYDEVAVASSAIPAVRDLIDDARTRSALRVIKVPMRRYALPVSGEMNQTVLEAWAAREPALQH